MGPAAGRNSAVAGGPGGRHYGWVIVAATFLTLLVVAGMRAAPGVLIVPLERDFGWTRATISFAVSINLLLYGLVGPFAAGLMEGIGVRRTMAISLAILAVGVSLTTQISQPWQLTMLWGVLVGCASGAISLSLSATVVARWFSRSRGLAMGILTAGTATGQLVFLPLLAAITESRGWQSATLLMAAAAAAMLPVVLLFVRDHPRDVGLRPYGETEEEARGSHGAESEPVRNPGGMALASLGVGLRSPDFWLLAGSFFVCGASTNGLIGTHLIPACIDHGIPEVRAAGLLAAMGVLNLGGTTLSGWLSDRFDNRYLLCWYYALRGLSLLGLPTALAGQTWGLSVFAVFYGLDWIATVPPTAKLTADAFGRKKAGIMLGWIFAFHQVGAALAAMGAGAVRTYLGDYLPAFLSSGMLCLIAAAMVLRIGRERRLAPAAV